MNTDCPKCGDRGCGGFLCRTCRREVRRTHSRSQTIPLACLEDGEPWPCATVERLRQMNLT